MHLNFRYLSIHLYMHIPRHIEDNGDWAKDCGELTEGFKGKIKSTFNVSSERAEKLYREMQQCMRRKHLVGGS